ncbi:MAG: hypothetical protein M5U28_41515 [Sandaracinaceae bacterium]|nr:hypothetical protein [Sandaracinaceae bacterium]
MVWIALIAAAVVLAALALAFAKPQLGADDLHDRAWEEFRAVADEVGGLSVVRTPEGWPRLVGEVSGVLVEIDCDNHVSRGLDGLLGLRCRVPDAGVAPDAALWIGDVDALRTQFGRPRPAGDGAGIFDVYTRVEPSASDWWQDPALHDALAGLPGAGVVLCEGQLTVLFARLDADSVRTALQIPGLVQEGVRRVTLH